MNNLVEESLKAYGKVDVLINNAFRVPSMKPLANTTFDHMRDAIERGRMADYCAATREGWLKGDLSAL